MKNYPPQFKADAVALYQSRPEATFRQIAAYLGPIWKSLPAPKPITGSVEISFWLGRAHPAGHRTRTKRP